MNLDPQIQIERLKGDREVYQTALAKEQSAHAFTAQERDALRAEVAALREDKEQLGAAYREQAAELAALRAAQEAERVAWFATLERANRELAALRAQLCALKEAA